MSSRGTPRPDARRVKRLRREAETAAEVERLNLRSLDDQSDQLGQPSTGNNAIMIPLVEEVFDISKILPSFETSQDSETVETGSESTHFNLSIGQPEQPSILKCADDDLSAHVPKQLKQKIWSNAYINIALLLKGNTELADMFSGGLLQVSSDGKIEARPRTSKEKVMNIDQWSDAFLIFASIYLQQFPNKTQQLLKYMSVIRDASRKYPVNAWRTYDEQIRMRQSLQTHDWGKLNADLWMRTMSTGPSTGIACREFNKGSCQFARCRYEHKCTLCGSFQHGMFRCTVGKSSYDNRPTPFRGFGANRFFRGSRGFRGFNNRRGFRGASSN